MSTLNIAPNIDKPDDIYEQLIRMHDGLNDADSQRVNAKLILLLINHIGDRRVVSEAIAAATASSAHAGQGA